MERDPLRLAWTTARAGHLAAGLLLAGAGALFLIGLDCLRGAVDGLLMAHQPVPASALRHRTAGFSRRRTAPRDARRRPRPFGGRLRGSGGSHRRTRSDRTAPHGGRVDRGRDRGPGPEPGPPDDPRRHRERSSGGTGRGGACGLPCGRGPVPGRRDLRFRPAHAHPGRRDDRARARLRGAGGWANGPRARRHARCGGRPRCRPPGRPLPDGPGPPSGRNEHRPFLAELLRRVPALRAHGTGRLRARSPEPDFRPRPSVRAGRRASPRARRSARRDGASADPSGGDRRRRMVRPRTDARFGSRRGGGRRTGGFEHHRRRPVEALPGAGPSGPRRSVAERERSPEPVSPGRAATLPGTGAFVAKGVSAYDPASGGRITGVDVSVAFPAHVALVGDGDVGPRLFASLIGGQLEPSTGRLTFGGVDLAKADPAERARRIAFAGVGRSSCPARCARTSSMAPSRASPISTTASRRPCRPQASTG